MDAEKLPVTEANGQEMALREQCLQRPRLGKRGSKTKNAFALDSLQSIVFQRGERPPQRDTRAFLEAEGGVCEGHRHPGGVAGSQQPGARAPGAGVQRVQAGVCSTTSRRRPAAPELRVHHSKLSVQPVTGRQNSHPQSMLVQWVTEDKHDDEDVSVL